MTRRQYSTGSVFQRKSDGKYVATIEAGYTATGGRRRISIVRATKAEAVRALKERQRQIAAEGIPDAAIGRATVKAWADTWLPLHRNDVKPRVFTNDRGNVTKWIVPTIGHRRLEDLTPAHVRAVIVAVKKAGRSSTTARNVHWTLMGMLKAARAEGHQIPARVTEVKAPVEATNDRDAIPLPDALRILQVALARPDSARWVASLLQGMRQGEVLGLTWPLIDLDRGRIDVSWQLQSLPYADPHDRSKGFIYPDGYEYRHLQRAQHLVRPKTARGRRVIPMVPWMHTALLQWRSEAVTNPWGLVWAEPDTHGNPRPVRLKDDRDRWKAIQAEAGVAHPNGRPFEGHEARHATISWLREAQVPETTIEAIVGHASLVRNYLHADDTRTLKALEAVADMLGLGAGENP